MKNIFILILFIFCGCNKEENIFLRLSPNTLLFASNEGVKDIEVESISSWFISTQLPSWLTIEIMQGESGKSHILVNVSENNTNEIRRQKVTFASSTGEEQLLIVQDVKEKLSINGEKRYKVTCNATKISVEVDCNVDYKLIISEENQEWIKYAKVANSTNDLVPSVPDFYSKLPILYIGNSIDLIGNNLINFTIAENLENKERNAEIIIYSERFELSDTIYVIQEASDKYLKYLDGDCLKLKQATKGNGVNIVFIGDGFTEKDLTQKGNYEVIMTQAANYFFSIEPYQSYRDYFNIYMVVAESKEKGVSSNNIFEKKVINKFSTTYGDGTAITCNDDLVFEYARKVKELPQDKPLTIIIPLNSTKYAGTTYLYSNGNSIALCPMSAEAPPNDFEGLIHHEAGGHGFGFLCDEYVYHKAQMPESRKNNLREWQKLGFQCNLDFTDDLSSILWKDFIGIDKYSHVGAYEGGYEYQYGVWRSESNSCMNNNIPYYNVQSRWSIVSRIMKLAGIDFTVQDFIEGDHVTSWSSATRNNVSENNLPPLGSPILIK